MNRHLRLTRIAICATWAMFGFERFCKHLKDWLAQCTNTEAVMWNAHAAFSWQRSRLMMQQTAPGKVMVCSQSALHPATA